MTPDNSVEDKVAEILERFGTAMYQSGRTTAPTTYNDLMAKTAILELLTEAREEGYKKGWIDAMLQENPPDTAPVKEDSDG